MRNLFKYLLDGLMIGAATPEDRQIVRAHLNPGTTTGGGRFHYHRALNEPDVEVSQYVRFSGQGEWEHCATYTVLAGGHVIKKGA